MWSLKNARSARCLEALLKQKCSLFPSSFFIIWNGRKNSHYNLLNCTNFLLWMQVVMLCSVLHPYSSKVYIQIYWMEKLIITSCLFTSKYCQESVVKSIFRLIGLNQYSKVFFFFFFIFFGKLAEFNDNNLLYHLVDIIT